MRTFLMLTTCLLTLSLPLAAAPLFTDDFNDGLYIGWTITDLSPTSGGPSAWNALTGAMMQTSNIYTTTDEYTVFTGTRASAGTASWTSYSVNLKVRSTDDDGLGVCFRLVDNTHYYRYFMVQDPANNGPLRRLEKRNGSTVTVLASTTLAWNYPSDWFNLSVWANGDSLTCFENGVPILGARDATYGTGIIALDCYANTGASFDDVAVSTDFIADTGTTRLNVGPFLQMPQPDGMTFVWETDRPARGRILYGLTQSYGDTVYASMGANIQNATVSGLAPGTTYYYKLEVGDTAVFGPNYTFKTNPDPASCWRMAWWGDNRTDSISHAAVCAGMNSHSPDLAINVGDIVSDGSVYSQYRREYFGPAHDLLAHTPSYISIGNHEGDSHWFYDYMIQPDPENYFAVTYANVRLIIVDGNQPYVAGTPQYNWLAAELASPATLAADFVLVVHHQPPYSEGWDSPGYDGEALMRTFLVPLYESSGVVDMVLAGHTHDYERGQKEGIYYVITGGGGSPLDHWLQDWPYMTVYYAVYQYIIMDVCGPSLTYRCYDLSGNVIDSLFLGVPLGAPTHAVGSRELGMTIAPAPISDFGTVTLTFPEQTQADLACYDFTGQWVRMLASKPFPAGESRVRLEARDLPSGVYYVVLRPTKGPAISKRVVLLR